MTKIKSLNAICKVVSVLYFAVVIYATFFSRRRDIQDLNFRGSANLHFMSKLSSYSEIDDKGKFFFVQDILGNIILFVPFVTAIYFIFPAKRSYRELFFLILSATFLIESLQFVFNIGVFDIDDIVLNLIGGIAGAFLFNFIFRKYVI